MNTHEIAHTHETAHATGGSANQPTHQPRHLLHVPGEVTAVRVNVAAQIAGVCRRTIYSWITRGLVETRFSPSGAVLIVVASLVKDERPAGLGRGNPNANRKVD